MNDFTIEELKIINKALINLNEIDISDSEETILYNKIHSMIDNYCNHESNKDFPLYKCIRCDSKCIDPIFKIKYGLHDWFLCIECSSNFYEWVIDKQADKECGWSKTHFQRKYGVKI